MDPSQRMSSIVRFAMIGIAVAIPSVWLMNSCSTNEVEQNGQPTGSGGGMFFLPRMFGGGSGIQSSSGATAAGANQSTTTTRGGFGSHFSSSS